jgi:hypothetical protein
MPNIETSNCRTTIMSHRAAAVASRAIELSLRGEPFTAADIRRGLTDPPSRSTVYHVLDELEADDWIAQRGNGWAPDTKATMLGDSADDIDDGRGGSFEIDTDDLLGNTS